MINQTERLTKAIEFAHKGHEGQIRKYTGVPYVTHCLEVMEIVSTVTSDEDVLIAAALHDVWEHVREGVQPSHPECGIEAIEKEFGPRVAGFVLELTDEFIKINYPKLNRKDRKRLEAERLGTISDESKTVKISDLLSNTRSIVEEDQSFARIYLDEKEALLPYLVGGNEKLLARAWAALIEGKKKLELTH